MVRKVFSWSMKNNFIFYMFMKSALFFIHVLLLKYFVLPEQNVCILLGYMVFRFFLVYISVKCMFNNIKLSIFSFEIFSHKTLYKHFIACQPNIWISVTFISVYRPMCQARSGRALFITWNITHTCTINCWIYMIHRYLWTRLIQTICNSF